MRNRFLSLLCVSFFIFTIPLSAAWVNVTSNLANMASECGNMCLLSAVPGKDKVIAGIAQKGLWATTDGGGTWTKLGTGAGSAVITNRTGCIVYDPLNPDIFWEAGIYNGGGVYKTTDGGVTFTQLGTIGHNDNVTIDFSDPQRKILLAGGHEQVNKMYMSTNGGQDWTDIGSRLPANSSFSRPYIINSDTFLVGCSGYNGTQGMFRSVDGGATFVSVGGTPGTQGPSADPVVLANGTILWELIYNRGIIRTANKGTNWLQVTNYGTLVTSHPVLMPNGSVAALGNNKILVSANVGTAASATWTQVGDALPTLASGVGYSGVIFEPVRSAFYTWNWDCGSVVRANAIMRFDYVVGNAMPMVKSVKHAGNSLITTAGSSILIPTSASGTTAIAYDLTGRIIQKRVLTGTEKSIKLSSQGVAIIKLGTSR
jgi:hypothetical protein